LRTLIVVKGHIGAFTMKIAEQAARYNVANIHDNSLPFTYPLNVNALSSIFRHTTNSYKSLFFLALLNKLKTQTKNTIFTFNAIIYYFLAQKALNDPTCY
jgi:hypothetical protein